MTVFELKHDAKLLFCCLLQSEPCYSDVIGVMGNLLAVAATLLQAKSPQERHPTSRQGTVWLSGQQRPMHQDERGPKGLTALADASTGAASHSSKHTRDVRGAEGGG